MKKFSALFIGILIAASGLAQGDNITYFDAYWNPTDSRENAEYYRIVERKSDHYLVRDYYISGTLEMTGRFSLQDPEIKEGYFIWYYPNGKKYAEGNFIHGQRDGIWNYWFPDGFRKEAIDCFAGKNDFEREWKSRRVRRSQDVFVKALQLKKKGDFEKAIKHFNKAIKRNPYFAEAFFERGLMKCEQQNTEEGCKDVLKAKEFRYPDVKSVNQALEAYCK